MIPNTYDIKDYVYLEVHFLNSFNNTLEVILKSDALLTIHQTKSSA